MCTAQMKLSRLLALGANSPLLQALECLGDYSASLKSLRQVSKEIGRLALLGLRNFTLSLKGNDQDTHVSGASLLQRTRLTNLTVHLRSSCFYRPANDVRTFLHSVGLALSNATFLDLHLEIIPFLTGASTHNTSVLLDAASLSASCPALLELHCSQGRLSSAFMQDVGMHCQLLSTLGLYVAGTEDDPYLQEILKLQPVLLPQVNKLILRLEEGHDYSLPDMTINTSILTLDVTKGMLEECEWLNLPPKLRHLVCDVLIDGPKPISANGTPLLCSLLSVTVGGGSGSNLHGIAQLLHAAPALQILQSEDRCYQHISIVCNLDTTTAQDLSVLHGRLDLELIKHARFTFIGFADVEDETSWKQILTSLPRMTGITRCILNECRPADMRLLLGVFPDLQQLSLYGDSLDDVELCAVGRCQNLLMLKLSECNDLTPMGVAMLCQQLPMLHTVFCFRCEHLTPSAQQKCALILRGYGRIVDFN